MSERLSRRAFFGGTAALVAAGHLPADESVRPPLADEPPLPPGVAQRLGSARFRELDDWCRFTPNGRWLALLEPAGRFVGYEVATGRRIGWQLPPLQFVRGNRWELTDGEVMTVTPAGLDANGEPEPLVRADLLTGRLLKTPNLPKGTHFIPTPDGTAAIGYQRENGVLWRADLQTGKTVWKRKWDGDAHAKEMLGEMLGKWLVLRGTQRLYLFDPLTGEPGPALEESPPNDPLVSDHILPLNLSADGRRLAGWGTANVPGCVVVWDVPAGKVVGRLTLPSAGGDPCFALSPDGSHLIVGGDKLNGLDMKTGKVVRTFPVSNVGRLILSPDGKVLLAEHGGSVQPRPFGGNAADVISAGPPRLLDPATGRRLPQSSDPATDVLKVRFADPDTIVATINAGWEASAPDILWNCRTGAKRMVLNPADVSAWSRAHMACRLSPDGHRHLTTVGNALWVTDAHTHRRLHAVKLPPAMEVGEALWLDRQTVGVFDRQTLFVCGVGTDHWRRLPLPFGKKFWGLDRTIPSADGRTLAISYYVEGADEGHVIPRVAWVDLLNGKMTSAELPARDCFSASVDGRRVAGTPGAGNDERLGNAPAVSVMVLDRGEQRFEIVAPTLGEGVPVRTELSACGRMVFLTHSRPDPVERFRGLPVLQFWEVLTRKLRAEFTLTDSTNTLGVNPARQLAASACGRRIATAHREAPVYLWDVYGEVSDPKPKPGKAELAAAWLALVGDAEKAFATVRRLVQHPAEATALLKEKLPPAEAIKPEWVQTRVQRLGSDDYATRSTAERELSAVADRIGEQLKDAEGDNAEADDRLDRIRGRAGRMTRDRLREVRAVEVLEYAGADALLKALAAGADCLLTREAKAAVTRRAYRQW